MQLLKNLTAKGWVFIKHCGNYSPFGLTMAGISTPPTAGKLENKYKYNGKEQQHQEFSDGSGLEWYDYGARFFDNQIGRFFTQDKFSEKYYNLTSYQYAGNNPIKYIDIDGNVIGNPDDPAVKVIKDAMMKSGNGARIWAEMEKLERTIFIYTSSNASTNILNPGITMSGIDYLNSSAGENTNSFSDNYKFNSKTGEYDKTSAWDNTVISININAIKLNANLIANIYNISMEEAMKIAYAMTGTHEGEHALQNYADFFKKVKK